MKRRRADLFKDMLEQFRFDIATGKIATGHRFPPEREMATRFGVTRTAIREVVRALELIGLVQIKPGRDGGIFTTSNCQELAGSSFTSLLALEPSGFPQSLEFRKIVEPRAAALAALRASEENIKTLRRSLDMIGDDIGDGEPSVDRYVESNRLFHETVAQATGNAYIFGVLAQFFEAPETIDTGRRAAASQWSLTRYFHRKVLDAIEGRNVKEAEVWMEAHLDQMEADLSRARDIPGGLGEPRRTEREE